MNLASRTGNLTALISTIEPIDGGVPTMTKWLCKLLGEYGITTSLAWYAPWRNYPKLSVPIYRVGRSRPSSVTQKVFSCCSSYGIGSWFPELEFTHYLPNRKWKSLINNAHLHFVVSGNTLAASPYMFLNVPYISWIATPWEADRRNRISNFSLHRKILDSIVNRPVLRYLERKILQNPDGTVVALSSYTSNELEKISNRKVSDVMLMPVDTGVYKPNYSKIKPWRIGFSGRYCDPRKNIDLLLQAGRMIRDKGHEVEIVLVGDKDSNQLNHKIEAHGLGSNVLCYQHMNPDRLSLLLQTLDVFVIPSYQEGLCISALEAMACGVPIISTRCGGPEEYVIPFETGLLIDFSQDSLTSAVCRICSDRTLRCKLSNGCYNWINEHASQEASRRVFRNHLYSLAKKRQLDHLLSDRGPL